MMPLVMACPQAVRADSSSSERLASADRVLNAAVELRSTGQPRRLSHMGHLRTSNCDSDCSLLRSFLLRRLASRRPRLLRLCAHGESALRDQVHGAVDRDADGAGFLVDPVVGAQRLFFVEADFVRVGCARRFPAAGGKVLLQVILVVAPGCLRVSAGSVGDQRTDRGLLRLRTVLSR